mgnify:CR=1 FL=1
MQAPDEAKLIAEAKAGNQAAMEALLQPYEDSVFRFLVQRLGNAHDAADVAQDSFVKALRGLKNYRDEGKFQAWLFQIARNESLNFMKKRNRYSTATVNEEGESRFDQEADPGPTAVESIVQGERHEMVRDCVSELPETEREVVTLRLDQDITFREIAEITQSPLNTVLGRMRNASKRLRECFSRKEIE